MLRFGLTTIGVSDLDRAATFWCSALGYTVSEQWSSDHWRSLIDAEGRLSLGLMISASPPEPHPRLHLDLFTDTSDEQRTEIRRLLELGASETDWDSYPAEPDFVVLADPDGNRFCVVDLSRAPSTG